MLQQILFVYIIKQSFAHYCSWRKIISIHTILIRAALQGECDCCCAIRVRVSRRGVAFHFYTELVVAWVAVLNIYILASGFKLDIFTKQVSLLSRLRSCLRRRGALVASWSFVSPINFAIVVVVVVSHIFKLAFAMDV